MVSVPVLLWFIVRFRVIVLSQPSCVVSAMMGVLAMEAQQQGKSLEIFSVHPGPTTTDLNGNMSLPGFHDIDTVGQKMAELINDGKIHQGEFIELYPIVKED